MMSGEASPLLRPSPRHSYGSLPSTRVGSNEHSSDESDYDPERGILKAQDDYGDRTSRSSSIHSNNGETTWRSKLQIPLLCYVRLMEPISYYSIFPYIAQMTRDNGNLADSDIGFYTGIFESLFSAVQALLLIFWGSMADCVGYKRMLICSMAGMTIAPVLFGLSTNLWQMAITRSLGGAFAGSNIILRAMLMHLCTPKTQVRAYSWYTFADNFALFVGPLMGGALADPVGQYPGVFKGIRLFEDFPYVLPGLVAGAACGSALLVTMFFLYDAKDFSGKPDDAETGVPSSRPSLKKLVKAPGVFTLLCTLMVIKMLVSSMSAVSTTALYTPVEEGGMSYSSRQISILIAAMGAVETVWLLLVFPFLHRRIGTKAILYLCTALFIAVFASYTFMSTTLRYGGKTGLAWHWVAYTGVVLSGSGVLMAGTSGQIALQNLTPDRRALGTLNAVAETCTSIVRTVTPAASTAIFAIGVKTQVLDGYLVWVTLICISPTLLVAAKKLPSWTDSLHK